MTASIPTGHHEVFPGVLRLNVTVKDPEHALREWAAADGDEQETRNTQARAAKRRRSVVRNPRRQFSAPNVDRVLGISK